MHKSAIFSVLAACAALVSAAAPPPEPESTTTLTSTSTMTKTVTLTDCGPDVPECTWTPTPEPSTSEPEPEPTYSAPGNATVSVGPSSSLPGDIGTPTDDSSPGVSEPPTAGASSASVQGGLLVGAAVLGFLALN